MGPHAWHTVYCICIYIQIKQTCLLAFWYIWFLYLFYNFWLMLKFLRSLSNTHTVPLCTKHHIPYGTCSMNGSTVFSLIFYCSNSSSSSSSSSASWPGSGQRYTILDMCLYSLSCLHVHKLIEIRHLDIDEPFLRLTRVTLLHNLKHTFSLFLHVSRLLFFSGLVQAICSTVSSSAVFLWSLVSAIWHRAVMLRNKWK